VATCLQLDTRFAGSNPAENEGFSKGDIRSTTSSEGK
jgi:hypothetical protein